MTGINRREVLGLLLGAWAGMGAAAAVPPSPAGGGMLHRPVPSTGELLPAIGLGTWQTFDVGSDAAARAALEQVLSAFVAAGGRVIDSSPMYGSAEEVAGDIAARLGIRDRLFIATKVWTHGKTAGVRQMEESRRKLRAAKLDLIQVHNLVDARNHLATLRDWKRQGRIRYIGITHYTASGHDEVARLLRTEDVDFVQINYSVGERDAERGLLPLAMDRGVAVIANRPFAGGDVIRRLRDRPLPPWAADIDCGSWAQLLLKFVVGHPALTCAIPATSKLSHLQDNMKAGLGRMPSDKQRALIAEAAR